MLAHASTRYHTLISCLRNLIQTWDFLKLSWPSSRFSVTPFRLQTSPPPGLFYFACAQHQKKYEKICHSGKTLSLSIMRDKKKVESWKTKTKKKTRLTNFERYLI